MKLDTFIKRPILSAVISVLIVLVGVLGALSLPIERYPDIAPPTVKVSTYFFGADAETLIKSVITPLEESINGVENMIYMQSSASNTGEVSISVVFKQGTNADMATVNVLNRVQKATAQLPAEVKSYGVTTEKSQNSILQFFTVYSPGAKYDYQFLSSYCAINIKPKVMLVPGIGEFKMLGSDYSMRVWLDPAKMKQHKLNPSDVQQALASQNFESATGSIGENSNESYQYTMRYSGRLKNEEQFRNIVIKSEKDGSVLRLSDVAKIELGSEQYCFRGETNGDPGVVCICYQSAGSNATAVNKGITEVLDKIQAEAPSGIQIEVLQNSNDFLYAAIEQVVETLRDAIVLVILIVLLFLKDFKSTVIPFISIMVSLIGTFAFMTIAGFSINLLTLFSLVLVIGTVVDDSIVVVEAVHANFEQGEKSPFKATRKATEEVAMPVLTSSLVFMAVFVPVSFMPGTSGVFYKQFGLTMAVAVGISALNALTLVPALSAMMLHPIEKLQDGQKGTFKQRYAKWFDELFEKFSQKYQASLSKVMKVKWLVWTVAAAGLAGLVIFMATMPSGLVPDEDQRLVMVEMQAPSGTSLYTTDRFIHNLYEEFIKVPGIEAISTTSGFGFISGTSSASGVFIIKLQHWEERKDKEKHLASIYANISAAAAKFPEVSCTVFSLPMIPGYGTSNGIDMYVQDRKGASTTELYNETQSFIQKLQANGLFAFMAFSMDFPQWEVSVDPAKCMRSGLTPQQVLGTLSAYYGGSYVNDLNLYSKVYKVMVMGIPDARRDELSLNSTYVRTASGEMAPLSSFATVKRVYGAESIKTFNKCTAINVSVVPMNGMSQGDAIALIDKLASTDLAEGYSVDYAGMSREQKEQGSLGVILLLCVFIIFLILASLYESVFIPVCVLMAVPLGLMTSFGVSNLVGLDNNIYLQTGVIMLIGLLAKTAILITEYAVERHKSGMDIETAAIEAAGARLRPIIMTVATMVIGLLPLVLSKNGVGGMGNFSLGLGTIFGMIVGTVGLLYITPILYTTFQKIQDKFKNADYDEE